MRHNATRSLLDYFNRIRGKDDAPLRRDVNPSDIPRLLPDIFMLEAVDNRWFRFRLAGTRLCAALGQEARGQEFGLVWTIDDRRRMTLAAQSVLANKLPFIIEAHDANTGEEVELLLLPMRSSETECDRLIGVFSRADPDRPLRMGMELMVEKMRFLTPDRPDPTEPEERPAPEAVIRARGVALRVYDGGKTN
ncbi:PAS domain-containing protein [Rhizobium sp. FKL33]|uniref:PAS domain-containing protein n=1 Tax=Rhizobium sp. FKL33 TaxID=2562307 RepID=UPI0010C010FE|nr:PAS domain-containing protein [Rhizobium sp. FKL33]